MLPRSSCLTFKTFLVRTKAREWLKFRWRRVWGEHKLKEIEKSKKIGKKCKTYINDMELKFANVKSKLDYEWKSAENWQVLWFFALFFLGGPSIKSISMYSSVNPCFMQLGSLSLLAEIRWDAVQTFLINFALTIKLAPNEFENDVLRLF